MTVVLRGARVVTPDEDLPLAAVLIEGDKIIAVGPDVVTPPGAEVIDLAGLTLVPGFIDLHVHGGGGFSLATRDIDEVRSYARWAPRAGVTAFLATICAADLEEGLDFIRVAAGAVSEPDGGAAILGLNLEGPFLNPDRRGALPPAWLLPPDVRTFDGIVQAAGGHLRLMTLAPELPGADRVLRSAVARGIVVSIGHSDTTFQLASRAFRDGASHLTHVFNAMRPLHHREPGPLGAAVQSSNVTVEVIADGVHLHPAAAGVLFRLFGFARIALITDAVTPAGLKSGVFRIGSQEAKLQGGRILLPDGTIAGSAATMDAVIRNVVDWGIADIANAVRMASTVPAGVAGVGETKGRIAGGYDADLVALDAGLRPVMTWTRGQLGFDSR